MFGNKNTIRRALSHLSVSSQQKTAQEAASSQSAVAATAADPERAKQLSQAVAEQVTSRFNLLVYFFIYFKTKNQIHDISCR